MNRPIGYRATANVLEGMGGWLYVRQLWRELFACEPPRLGRSRLEFHLAHRINAELFPIEIPTWLNVHVDYLPDEYSLLAREVSFPSIGVCWKRAYWGNMCFGSRPVLVAVAPMLGISVAQQAFIYTWCARRAYARPLQYARCLERFGSVRAVIEYLKRETARLEGPLRGLAVEIAAVVGDNGNPFLDEPPGYSRLCYGRHTYPWKADTIRWLAEQYRGCRDDLARCEEYRNRFLRWRGAAKKVYLTLMDLIEGG